MASVPSSVVEIAIASDPMATSPAWTDVSADVVGIGFREGAEHELSDVDATTAEVRLRNRTGKYSRQNPASPYFPDLTIGKRIRWRTSWDGDTHAMFDGWIDGFDPQWDPANANEEIMVLRVVGAHQVASLCKVPVTDDVAAVIEDEFDPLFGYWRLSDQPGTKVITGGKAKPLFGPRRPPRAGKGSRRLATVAGQVGPEGIAVGNPTFLVAGAGADKMGPVAGERSYGIQFARSSSQYVKFPISDADDLPGSRNRIVVGVTFRMTSLSLNGQVLVGGPLFTSGNVVPWRMGVQNIGGVLHAVWIVAFSDGTTAQCDTVPGLPSGIDTTEEFYTLIGTWNGATGTAQLFSKDSLVDTASAASKTMRRGNAPGHIFVGGHQAHTAAGGSNFYADAVISEVFVSEKAIPDGAPLSAGQRVKVAFEGGLGWATYTPESGTRIGEIFQAVGGGVAALYGGLTGVLTDLDVGTVEVEPQRWDGATALDLIREAERTEDGLFWFAGDGKATFRDAAWRAGDGYEVKARFTDRPIGTYGIAVGGAFEFMSTTDIAAAFADMKALGIRQVRGDIKWSQVEATQGVYVWEAGGGGAKYDTVMAEALKHGIDFIATCGYSPPWVTGAGSDDKVAPSTTGERDAHAAFVKAVAERYGPKARWNVTGGGLKAIEPWNEPNLGNTFYKPAADPAGYVDLLQRDWNALMSIDPNVLHPSRRPLLLAGCIASSSHYMTGDYAIHSGALYQSPTDDNKSTPPTGWTNKTPYYGTWNTGPTNYVTGGFTVHNSVIYQLTANDNAPRSGGATPDVTPSKYAPVWAAWTWDVNFAKGREPGRFLQQMIDAGAIGYFDHLSAHPYIFDSGAGLAGNIEFALRGFKYQHNSGSFLGDSNSLRSIMVTNGLAHKQIWITETSYDGVSDATRAGAVDEILDAFATYGYVGPISWYTYYVNGDARSIVGAPPTFTHDTEWAALQTYFADADPLELPYRSLATSDDLDFLYNTTTVTRDGGTPQTVSDNTSIAAHGSRQMPEISTLHTTDAAALTHAQTMLARYKDPRERVTSIDLSGAMDSLMWPKILGLQLFDRVVVRRMTPGGVHIMYDCRVRGRQISVRGRGQAAAWSCTLQLAPEPF